MHGLYRTPGGDEQTVRHSLTARVPGATSSALPVLPHRHAHLALLRLEDPIWHPALNLDQRVIRDLAAAVFGDVALEVVIHLPFGVGEKLLVQGMLCWMLALPERTAPPESPVGGRTYCQTMRWSSQLRLLAQRILSADEIPIWRQQLAHSARPLRPQRRWQRLHREDNRVSASHHDEQGGKGLTQRKV